MERVGLFEKWGGESITWLLRKCISSGAACSSVQQFTAFLTAGEQLQVKQKWHYFRTRISVPEIWIDHRLAKIFLNRLLLMKLLKMETSSAIYFWGCVSKSIIISRLNRFIVMIVQKFLKL